MEQVAFNQSRHSLHTIKCEKIFFRSTIIYNLSKVKIKNPETKNVGKVEKLKKLSVIKPTEILHELAIDILLFCL